MEEWHLEAGKRKKFVPAKLSEAPCGKAIKETHEIPEELKLGEIWDGRTMHAFLQDQRIDEEFVIAIQKEFAKLREEIKRK